MPKKIKTGKVIIPSGVIPWDHELRVAHLLAGAGHIVEFLSASNVSKTADFRIDGVEYELKSPVSNKMTSIERNLKRASKQSCNIVFDSSRMKKLRDDKIYRTVVRKLSEQPTIHSIIYVSKNGKVTIL